MSRKFKVRKVRAPMKNINTKVVDGFGDEWSSFDQSILDKTESRDLFNRYFNIFPSELLKQDKIGIDIGCGSGRWAKHVAPLVGKLYCIDASVKALEVARKNLVKSNNCVFKNLSTDSLKSLDKDFDFGYSLGVLHHIPDTQKALSDSVSVLKKGAPFLLYLYFAFDNKPAWYRLIWRASELFRYIISRSPFYIKIIITNFIASLIYFPLARGALLLEKIGIDLDNVPMSSYKETSFYTMRTDALDRFGTRLEQRFTREEVYNMMTNAGLINIEFSENVPYWTAVGYKG